MVAHERAGDTNESVGDVAHAGRLSNLAPEPPASAPIEDEADNNANQNQDDGGSNCRC